jgi:diguanylate cyclase (GGDEF)-like protein
MIVLITLLFAGLRRQSENLQRALLHSMTDFNTGLKNRRALEEELSRLLFQALRKNSPLSVLFIDIDHFKPFNDLHGHDMGDRILRIVAQCIAELSRRPLDYCCRWGGEEFVMVLPETTEEEAVIVANKLKESVEKMEIKEMRLTLHEQITLSIGIATTRSCPNPTPEALINLADQAMLRAKIEGRNRVVML